MTTWMQKFEEYGFNIDDFRTVENDDGDTVFLAAYHAFLPGYVEGDPTWGNERVEALETFDGRFRFVLISHLTPRLEIIASAPENVNECLECLRLEWKMELIRLGVYL